MKAINRSIALFLLLSVLFSLGISTVASPASDIQKELDNLGQQADEIEEQKQALKEQIDATESEILSFTEKKFQIDQEIELLRLEVENLTAQIHQYNLLIAEKQSEVDALQAELDALTDRYVLRMRAIQEQGEISEWSVIFSAASFEDMLNRRAMTQEIAKSDQRMMDELRQATADVLHAKDALGEEKTALELKKADQAIAENALKEKREVADAMLSELATNKAKYLEEMESLEEEELLLTNEIAQKEKEYYDALNAANQGNGNQGDPTTVPPTESGFIFPLASSGYVCITDAYGMRYHPTTGQYSMHTGVDFAAYLGTSIYASKSGVVTTAESHYIWGNYVVINHGDGTSTLYAHMDYDAVNVGDYVAQGQTIGYVGSTGWSTGPHLHFTIYINGSTVNPVNYVTPPW